MITSLCFEQETSTTEVSIKYTVFLVKFKRTHLKTIKVSLFFTEYSAYKICIELQRW